MFNDPIVFMNWSLRCTKGALSVYRLVRDTQCPVYLTRVEKALELLRLLESGYPFGQGELTRDRLQASEVHRVCRYQLDKAELRWSIVACERLLAGQGEGTDGEIKNLLKTLDFLAEHLELAAWPHHYGC